MKKRVLAMLLAFCLIFTLLPTVAMAADLEISTLEELVQAFPKEDGYIVIDADATVTGDIDTFLEECNIRVNKDVTLTIANGGKVRSGFDNNGTIVVEAGGTISTTMNGHIVNKGTITVNEGGQLITGWGGKLKNESGSTCTMNGTFYLSAFWGGDTEYGKNVMMYYEEGEEVTSEGTGKVCIYHEDANADISKIVPEISAYFDTCTFTRSTGVGAEDTPIEPTPIEDDPTPIDAEPVIASTLEELMELFPMQDSQIVITSDVTIAAQFDTWEIEGKICINEGVTVTIADGAWAKSGFDNYGTIIVEDGGTISSRMGGKIINCGKIIVNEGGQLITGWGEGQVWNEGNSTMIVNGTFYLATIWGEDTEYGKNMYFYYNENENAISEGDGKVCILTEDATADISKIVSAISSYFDTCTITRSTGVGEKEIPIDGEPTVCPQDETCVYAKFTDADPAAWYHDGVHYCVENELMNGVSETAFNPDGTTTRAMIVTILWRMEGEPAVDYDMSFTDVEADQWYTEAIRWAQSTGVVEGYSAEKFDPNAPITREQMATILYRYAKNHGIDVTNDNTLDGFTDAAKVSAWALDAMQWANAVGLVQGRTETTLVPEVSIKRSEAATMMQRYCTTVSIQ